MCPVDAINFVGFVKLCEIKCKIECKQRHGMYDEIRRDRDPASINASGDTLSHVTVTFPSTKKIVIWCSN